MRKLLVLLAIGLMSFGAVEAANATIIYNFIGLTTFDGSPTTSFTLETPSFITSYTDFITAQFSSYSVSDGSPFYGAQFNPNENNWSALADAIGLVAGNNCDYYFDAGDFSKIGTFYSIILNNQQAKLVITDSDSAPVPEPGTMMLLGLGMAGLAVYCKRSKNIKI